MFATRGCPSLKPNARHAVTHSLGTPASNLGPAAAVTELPELPNTHVKKWGVISIKLSAHENC